ncbi:hypothetical protein, partial [Shinella sp. JR1-6]|uniref:hypothetical protein n=1 Tax=Shinella sp. JR1-6 TaxID=2527671 RepID=UPI001A9D8210
MLNTNLHAVRADRLEADEIPDGLVVRDVRRLGYIFRLRLPKRPHAMLLAWEGLGEKSPDQPGGKRDDRDKCGHHAHISTPWLGTSGGLGSGLSAVVI